MKWDAGECSLHFVVYKLTIYQSQRSCEAQEQPETSCQSLPPTERGSASQPRATSAGLNAVSWKVLALFSIAGYRAADKTTRTLFSWSEVVIARICGSRFRFSVVTYNDAKPRIYLSLLTLTNPPNCSDLSIRRCSPSPNCQLRTLRIFLRDILTTFLIKYHVSG